MSANQYKTTLAFVDPAFLDGAITDDHLRQNAAGARRIAEAAIMPDQDQIDILELDLQDSGVAERERKNDLVINRIIADQKINVGDPAFAQRAETRNKFLYAQRALTNVAVGDNPEGEAFIEPESSETYQPAPKAAAGFAIVKKRRRRM